MKLQVRNTGATALVLLFSMAGAMAHAQESAMDSGADGDKRLETVVITGSLLLGDPEQSPLPIESYSADDLAKLGSPGNVEFIKSLPMVGATIAGDANPLLASRVEGASSLNLRGLGNARTLVLLNGRRIAPTSSGLQTLTDINAFPLAAVGQVEILKDGGSATYGSDAIAGVANFTIRRDIDGLDVGGDYSFVDGSDGDYQVYANWGWVGDNGNILVSAAHQHRSELAMSERDWSSPDYLENPSAWSAYSNPGVYLTGSSLLSYSGFVDPGCEPLGGELTPEEYRLSASFSLRAPACQYPYAKSLNIVDEQDRSQLYFETNLAVSPSIDFHLDALYSTTRVPRVKISASQPTFATGPTFAATGGPAFNRFNGFYFIPADNPGLQDMLSQYNAADLGLSQAAYDGIPLVGVNARYGWRPFALGGNPAFNDSDSWDFRNYDVYRVSGGLSGDTLADKEISWETNFTYSETLSEASGKDQLVNRMQYALRGLGGADCTPGGSDPATSTPGTGPCQWLNPFSTGIQQSALTGQTNPDFVGNSNDPDLVRWFTSPDVISIRNQLDRVPARGVTD
ncbi:TonB-dependent receptor plug domain-containing protein, partial [Hyphomonas oceanitis]